MKYFIVGLLLSGVVACSSNQTPKEAIEFADEQLINGGLEDPTTRAKVQARYDEALRIYQADRASFSSADADFIESHANFGLAMTKIWDLLEQLEEILEKGDFFNSVFPPKETKNNSETVSCAILDQLPNVEVVVQSLLDTAVLPIADSLREVVKYPNFSLDIQQAYYKIEAFDQDESSNQGINLTGQFGIAEAELLLAVLDGVDGLAKFAFSYEGLIEAIAKFGLVNFRNIEFNPSKYFNSNPCVGYSNGNPLLDSQFGLLRESGPSNLARAKTSLISSFSHLRKAFVAAQIYDDDDQKNDILSIDSCKTGYKPGCGFAGGIVDTRNGDSRFKGISDRPSFNEGISTLEAAIGALTPLIDLKNLDKVLGQIESALANNGEVPFSEILVTLSSDFEDPSEDVETVKFLGAEVPKLSGLRLPILDIGVLFRSPISDLKNIAPLVYSENEAFEDKAGQAEDQGVRNVDPKIEANEAVIVGEDSYSEQFFDTNCDGFWNQKGDMLMHREREPYVETVVNGKVDDEETGVIGAELNSSEKIYPGEAGVIGTFVDANSDSQPDRESDDVFSGVGSFKCDELASYPVTWPGGSGDILNAIITVTESSEGYMVPISDGNPPATIQNKTPVVVSSYEDGPILGRYLGHYWPSVDPNDLNYLTGARRDPSNGVFDEYYWFWSDPTFGGLFRKKVGNSSSAEAWTNADTNRMFTDFAGLLNLFE